MKNIEVAAGIICNHGKILIAQRRKKSNFELLWEFPGGKRERGESLQECLAREIMEELGLQIEVGKFFQDVICTYENVTIKLSMFFAKPLAEMPLLLNAHEQAKWVSLDELTTYDLVPADKTILDELLMHFQSNTQYLA
ncbi:MAG: (deoxy)nucleoside triphosphate pyrophosphohydrolase [Alphaproteobacteria bacterium]|nr:(deoxy)nucleoside triphosphate pyrophosphohydrolase [Alphaproteobacteria bacterium]